MMKSLFPRHVALLAAILLVVPHLGLGRDRGPRVEVVCPFSPSAVQIHDKQAMVYELHVTNFDSVLLTLKRVEVFANSIGEQPIASLADTNLERAMVRIGAGGKNTPEIQPGARAVVFMWVELPLASAKPASLHHRMIFASPREGATPGDVTLTDFSVAVNRSSPPVLSPPFRGGTWLAGDAAGNNSAHRRSIAAIDGHIYSAERFAIDWVKVGPNGDSHHDGSARNENSWGYGEPVLAVADGEVTEVVDGIPENTPHKLPKQVTLDNIAGNHVIVQIAPGQFATFAHLQNGSIKVRLHQRVGRGEVLGLLGNTGNADGPHLHFQLTDRNSVLQAEGIPFVFAHFTYLGLGQDYEPDKHPSERWEHSIPPDGAVVEFK